MVPFNIEQAVNVGPIGDYNNKDGIDVLYFKWMVGFFNDFLKFIFISFFKFLIINLFLFFIYLLILQFLIKLNGLQELIFKINSCI